MQIPEQLASSEANIIKAQQQAHSLINSSVSQQSSKPFALGLQKFLSRPVLLLLTRILTLLYF